MWSLLWTLPVLTFAAAPPTAGVIADDLADYSQWAAAHKGLWHGEEVGKLLAAAGLKPEALDKDDLTLEGLSRYDAILVATDNAYPERGAWGGPVAKALVEYVRQGGIYVMPIGIPHWAANDLDTGKLDSGHMVDFFDLRGSVCPHSSGLPKLTAQGHQIALPDPVGLTARPARLLDAASQAVLVWNDQYVPMLTVIPFGKGWLIHWGGGEMDRASRDYVVPAFAGAIKAAKAGQLRVMDQAALLLEEGVAGKSLDELDREAFAPAPAPFDGEPEPIGLTPDDEPTRALYRPRPTTSLDGSWEMLGVPTGTGDARALVHGQGWEQAIAVEVPCSVQTALFAAGKIPDPTIALNDRIARREVAEKEWWFRKTFTWSATGPTRLIFDGVDYSATFFLNGVRLGEHEGPFGGPHYDITGLLDRQNTLIVRIDPLPADWKTVFKTNCVYGWHYVDCPPIGIWRSVRIESVPKVAIKDFFVAATDVQTGQIDVSVEIVGPATGYAIRLAGRVRPANFVGPAYRFMCTIQSHEARAVKHLRFNVPAPRPWWPVDLGEPNLYHLELALKAGDFTVDAAMTRFGIRTIEMAPLPGGPSPDKYNWTFVINGRPTFLKGCNWCTLDAFLRLPESRYRRFLALARDEHIQIMRSWGGGLLETDTFYDLCDEMGIMVWQEFPLTWQNFEVIRPAVADEIACRNIIRLRNHPSLVMWCGGNEHHGQGRLVELLGRRCLELDGTRPFHRTDPYGGSVHDYGVYWGKQPYEHNIQLVPMGKPPAVIGETGLASTCSLEGTLRYLPEDEREIWPPPEGGSFIHHTPTFTPANMDHLNRHAGELDKCQDLAGFVRGTQLAQAIGLRTVIERMRCQWPDATCMAFYKLTDVYPGCSWATVDYYGIPKIAHYAVRQAYAPLHVCALFDSFDALPEGKLQATLFLLDDMETLRQKTNVVARLFDARLKEVGQQEIAIDADPQRVRNLGPIELPVPKEHAVPLLLLVELRTIDNVLDRQVYAFNFRQKPGCLFELPKTTLTGGHREGKIIVANTGGVPAVGVHVQAPEVSDALRLDEGYFWLEPGQTYRFAAEVMPNIDGTTPTPMRFDIAAWNADPQAVAW